MHYPIITGVEHQSIDFEPYHREWLVNQGTHWQKAETLGLHLKDEGYAPGNFIGMVWIGEGSRRSVLRVHSKFPQMDYIKMFADCYAHPNIGSRVDQYFKCWLDQDYIDVDDSLDFLPVIIILFLSALNQLCARHLRKNFEQRRENFIGKVKGKINVSENLRQNIVRGRLDRVFCEFQSFSDDILENRILRAALEQAARYVARNNILKEDPELQRKIHACRSHLQSVSVMPVSRPQFAAARNHGVFAFYRSPLHYAKMVLLKFGFNPHEEIVLNSKTPPFAINSAKLFERYAELQLRKKFSAVQAEKSIPGSGDYPVSVEPDFYVPKGEGIPHIIDAKYKYLPQSEHISSDIYQVIAYSRHKGMLQALGCSKDDDMRLSLVYPLMGDSGQPPVVEHAKITSFYPDVHIDKIPCPVIEEEKT